MLQFGVDRADVVAQLRGKPPLQHRRHQPVQARQADQNPVEDLDGRSDAWRDQPPGDEAEMSLAAFMVQESNQRGVECP